MTSRSIMTSHRGSLMYVMHVANIFQLNNKEAAIYVIQLYLKTYTKVC